MGNFHIFICNEQKNKEKNWINKILFMCLLENIYITMLKKKFLTSNFKDR